ncbi:MAG: ComEC/Rec2 family competence protein [Maribacter sp.]
MEHRFVGLPKKGQTFLYRKEGSKLKKTKQVLWGDWLSIDITKSSTIKGKKYLAVIWGPKSPDPKTYYILEEHTDEKRPMELIFLDVGQGDGCVLITPERNQNERIMIIDAGKGDNMNAFLEKRFKTYRNKFQFEAAILTHPDNDHYLGFESIFANEKIGFNNVYHNGINERPVSGSWEKVGDHHKNHDNGISYVHELVETKKRLEELYDSEEKIGNFQYPKVMHTALMNSNIKGYKMLSVHEKHSTQSKGRSYMKGFAPVNKRDYTIEVLGPVPEENAQGELMLRKLSSYGETKNGHSILLRLHYGNFKIFFGGDLNIPAEKFLLQHYANKKKWPKSGSAQSAAMIEEAQEWFRSDVMKVCHHGSEKVTDEFIKAVDPACFIISSGDEEGHVHPRPDLLGRLGKLGRSSSPVILSTELQRSTRESEDQKVIDRLKKNAKKIRSVKDEKLDEHTKSVYEDIDRLGRTNVSVFGSIYIKTDGERLIAAFKNEADSETKKWFYFEYHLNNEGELVRK